MIKNSRYECFIDYNSLNGKINDVENKMQNTSNLETTTVLNTKISEDENKYLLILNILLLKNLVVYIQNLLQED